MSIGENVKWRRLALGISQTDLAGRIYIRRKHPDKSYVSRLEAGKVDPSLSAIRSLAKALHCQPWQLVAEIYESCRWWDYYLALGPTQKREVQRIVRYYSDRRAQ
jgi:transcriptional regulator with XRE-family HTH domain